MTICTENSISFILHLSLSRGAGEGRCLEALYDQANQSTRGIYSPPKLLKLNTFAAQGTASNPKDAFPVLPRHLLSTP